MRNQKSTIIAEAGVNHNGSIELAEKLVEVAVASGADIVKFQTFKADNIVTKQAHKAQYQKKATGSEETQYEMLKKLELNREDHFYLASLCKASNIEFLSTAFDADSVSFLVNEIGIKRIKVPSGEITNAPLLLHMARFGLPIIISTGMATLGEIEQALGVLAFGLLNSSTSRPSPGDLLEAYVSDEGFEVLQKNVTIMQCTSEYPAAPSVARLSLMPQMGQIFGLNYGYSDHTEGLAVSMAARALGAIVIEKHFTLDKEMKGPDHRASLNPGELKDLVCGIRDVEAALSGNRKVPSQAEMMNRHAARRSIVAAQDISVGECFTPENLTLKRPGTGVSPYRYWQLLDKMSRSSIAQDEVLGEAEDFL
ncbi:N-acetylneuraminate synthase [Oligoflexus tunisiensis]|uniref:N-acetylneuraminate synthase n=1 Tax=Oligoflexus tunisiensis TaxID=708132 RepID=UPI000A416F77|nr:N-acetylneuraminate synthase [Oligoflexus tunisiensis]